MPWRLNDCPLDCHGIYAYTFEAPALTDAADASAYSYIHNYLSGDDIVTRIPMWSLTRYGNVYDLKAEVEDESLHEELVKLGSSAADFTQSDVTEKVDQIISYLEERIGSRADYSLERNDTFADEQGNPLDISYCYQTALADVMGFIFSGALDDLSSQVLDRLDDLVEPAYQLYDAVNHENDGNIEAAMACYYAAATGFHEVLETFTEEPLSIGVEDIYALLKLIGPFGVNADYEFSGDSYDVISIISPLVTLAMNASSYTYSHTFDTVLARLKALAPQKALTDINIEVSVPQAEDALNKAVDEATADIADLGYAWLTCQAYWDTDDTSLQEGTVYYLHVTLTATGHVTNEDFALTLNGESPLDSYHISYANGATIVNAIWKFSIGESQQVQVCFDNGHGKDIGILSVDRGTALRYEDLPEYDEYVSDDLGKWHFYGWQDQDGNSIENLIVTENTTVYAKWKQVVDEIAVHLDIPSAGHKMNDPYVDEDALYCIGEYNAYIDELYDEFEVVEAGLSYAINIFVKLKDEETVEFITEDFVDWKEYSGVFLVNGEEIDDPFYDEYYGYVQATYIFHAMEEVIEEQADYSLKEGEGSHYELGSNTGLVFVVKRSVNDEETFDHFAGIKVDGTILDATMYEAERGSAVISLTNTYLNTLTTGSHTLEILFDDGSITTSFTITAKEPIVSKETPNTQDTSHIGLWHALLWIGILGSGSAAVILTKAAH